MSRVLQSENIDLITKALVSAQGEIGHALKDSKNPHFNSKFASLEAVIDVTKIPFLKNGLAVIQQPTSDDLGHSLVTTIAHTSGQWIRSFTPLMLEKQTYQSLGAGISYMRRYSLAAMANIGQEDDDGNQSTSLQNNDDDWDSAPTKPPEKSNTSNSYGITANSPWPFTYPEGLKTRKLSSFASDELVMAESQLLRWKNGKSKDSYPKEGDAYLAALRSRMPKQDGPRQ